MPGSAGSVPPPGSNLQQTFKDAKNNKGGDITKPFADAAKAVEHAVTNNPLTDTGKFLAQLFQASLWERIGLILLGVALVIVGIVLLLHKSGTPIPIPVVAP